MKTNLVSKIELKFVDRDRDMYPVVTITRVRRGCPVLSERSYPVRSSVILWLLCQIVNETCDVVAALPDGWVGVRL